MESAGQAITIIGGCSAIGLAVFRVVQWLTQKDSADAVTAEKLALKADRHEVASVNDRLDRIESDVASIKDQVSDVLSKAYKMFDDIRQKLEVEHRTRSDQHIAQLASMAQIAVQIGIVMDRSTGLSGRVAALEHPEGRRISDRREGET